MMGVIVEVFLNLGRAVRGWTDNMKIVRVRGV